MHKNHIGLLSAIFLGVSAIIGSGWLFAPYKAAYVAGPAAIFSWIIGALLVILLGLCFAEIASVYPKRGLSAIIPTLSHNKFFGFPFAIANWFGVVAVIGLEADATIQYLINLAPSLEMLFFHNGQMTWAGNGLSVLMVIAYCLVNYWGAKMLAKTNNFFTVVKLIVPIVTALVIIAVAFHPSNFKLVNHSLVPYGFKSILVALITSGIIIAFNGFQSIVSFASEIKNPHKTIPISLVISVVLCLGVYLLLQVAFIGAIPQKSLQGGWNHISMSAPMVQLSLMLGLGLVSSIIYFGATIAPSGTAITFTGSATRMFTAMSRREQMPKFFDDVHPHYRVSRRSLIMNTILSIVFLLLFRSWSQLAQLLSLIHIVSYLPIPIAIVVFRNKLPKSEYNFLVPCGKLVSFLLFIIFTYLMTLINDSILINLMLFFGGSLAVFIVLNIKSVDDIKQSLRKCYALILYFLGIIGFAELSLSQTYRLPQFQYLVLFVMFFSFTFYLMTRQTAINELSITELDVDKEVLIATND